MTVGVGGTEVAVAGIAVAAGSAGVAVASMAVGVEGRHPPNTTASPIAMLSIMNVTVFAFIQTSSGFCRQSLRVASDL